MDLNLGAPIEPEPLTTKELEDRTGLKIEKQVLVVRHGGRRYWRQGDFFFDLTDR